MSYSQWWTTMNHHIRIFHEVNWHLGYVVHFLGYVIRPCERAGQYHLSLGGLIPSAQSVSSGWGPPHVGIDASQCSQFSIRYLAHWPELPRTQLTYLVWADRCVLLLSLSRVPPETAFKARMLYVIFGGLWLWLWPEHVLFLSLVLICPPPWLSPVCLRHLWSSHALFLPAHSPLLVDPALAAALHILK